MGVLFDHVKDPKTHAIIGAAMEVHRELGNGFLEAVYQEALEREFSNKDIPFQSQPEVQISYKGQLLNKAYYPDSRPEANWPTCWKVKDTTCRVKHRGVRVATYIKMFDHKAIRISFANELT